MNIWIISPYCGSSKHGMHYRHFYLAQDLKKYGIDVQIIASSFSHLHSNRPETTGKITYETIDGVPFAWIKTNSYSGNGIKRIINMLFFSLRLAFNAKKIKLPKPDAVIASSPHPFVFFNGHHLKKKFKCKFISEIRDIWPLSVIKLSSLTQSNPLVRIMSLAEKVAYQKSDATVSLLPNALDHMKSVGLQEKNFYYIPNGIKLDSIKSDYQSETLAAIPSDKFIVGYTGSFGDANALEYFVKAALLLKDHPTIHFLLVGDGFTKKDLVAIANGAPNITFHPRIKKDQVATILERIDLCYIGLRRNDLFHFGISPNKIFDYMNAKKPILMAIEAGNDLVAEADCGLTITPEDENSIAQGVLEIFNMPKDRRNQLGNNGYHFLIRNHTYDIIAEKYKNLLNEVTNQD